MGWKDYIGPAASVAFGTRVGDTVNSLFNQPSGKREYKRQKEFAQNAIQWRVQDAIAAGLHPLAALGMPVASYSPSLEGGGSDLQSEISGMGADISRAMGAADSPVSKADAQYQALQLEHMGLSNDLLRSQIAKMNQAGTPPGIVAPFGQGTPPAGISNPNKNQDLQPHYGEGADVLTYPDMAYDLLRVPGGPLNPQLERDAKAVRKDAAAAINAAIATLQQWYTPGGWNRYWR